jgi:hypothetical protein
VKNEARRKTKKRNGKNIPTKLVEREEVRRSKIFAF